MWKVYRGELPSLLPHLIHPPRRRSSVKWRPLAFLPNLSYWPKINFPFFTKATCHLRPSAADPERTAINSSFGLLPAALRECSPLLFGHQLTSTDGGSNFRFAGRRCAHQPPIAAEQREPNRRQLCRHPRERIELK